MTERQSGALVLAGRLRIGRLLEVEVCAVELSGLLEAVPILDDDPAALMRLFPLSSCSVRFTWTVERPVASARSAQYKTEKGIFRHAAGSLG